MPMCNAGTKLYPPASRPAASISQGAPGTGDWSCDAIGGPGIDLMSWIQGLATLTVRQALRQFDMTF
jgi:hypothetical protein